MEPGTVDAAFTRIYNETYDHVLSFLAARCQSYADLEDLAQNVYLNLYQRLQNKGPDHVREPKRYLLRIARDELCRHYGRLSLLRRSIPVFSGEAELPPEEELRFLSEDGLQDRVDLEEVWDFIRAKEERTVTILTMYLLGGRKIGEIARRLGESESFVKNRLYRTLREIRAEFGKEDSL